MYITILRVGLNRIYILHMTVYLVVSLPKITVYTPCIYIYIYMVLANPNHSAGIKLV